MEQEIPNNSIGIKMEIILSKFTWNSDQKTMPKGEYMKGASRPTNLPVFRMENVFCSSLVKGFPIEKLAKDSLLLSRRTGEFD